MGQHVGGGSHIRVGGLQSGCSDRSIAADRESIREAHPDDAIVLYLITDGEQTSNVTRRTFSSLRQYLNDGFTVGVGSTEGGKIPVIADGVSAGDSNTTDHWVVDPDTGEPGISKMDEKNLKDIADEISGTYVAVNASQTLADSVFGQVIEAVAHDHHGQGAHTHHAGGMAAGHCVGDIACHGSRCIGSQPQGDCCEKQ